MWGAAAQRDSHHVSTARSAVANEGIETAFRGILARHGRPEAVRAPRIPAFHPEGRRPPDTPLWKHRLAATPTTADELSAGGGRSPRPATRVTGRRCSKGHGSCV